LLDLKPHSPLELFQLPLWNILLTMVAMLTRSILAAAMFLSPSLSGETPKQPTQGNFAEKDNLQQYTACQFGEKTAVEERAERGQPFLLPVNTSTGESTVEIVHGFSLHIAYDKTPFVNFKAERLGRPGYERDKQILIDSLVYSAAHTPDMESLKPKQATLNGFELYSIARKQLAGGVLSVYLLFRDADRTVITLYFLNTPPEDPKFHTVEQYSRLRDAFLGDYTSCVSKNLQNP
jgi:hypothetical protein